MAKKKRAFKKPTPKAPMPPADPQAGAGGDAAAMAAQAAGGDAAAAPAPMTDAQRMQSRYG